MPEPVERLRAQLRERRGYRWVEETFRRHRRSAEASQRRRGRGARSPFESGCWTPGRDNTTLGEAQGRDAELALLIETGYRLKTCLSELDSLACRQRMQVLLTPSRS